MSRTRPETHTSNPAEYKLEWVGHEEGGYFKVWDREAKKEIKMELPLRFAYLDDMKAIAGFYESVGRGFFSNEVRYTKHEPFDVRYYKDGNVHPVAKGLYNDIKGDIGNKGAKFCNVVYATLLNSNSEDIPGGSLVKLPLVGACNSEWIDLGVKDGESFEITGFEDRKKGRTSYRAPLFSKIEITDEEGAIADEQDEALQAFFTASKKEEAPLSTNYTDSDAPAEPEPEIYEDEVPF